MRSGGRLSDPLVTSRDHSVLGNIGVASLQANNTARVGARERLDLSDSDLSVQKAPCSYLISDDEKICLFLDLRCWRRRRAMGGVQSRHIMPLKSDAHGVIPRAGWASGSHWPYFSHRAENASGSTDFRTAPGYPSARLSFPRRMEDRSRPFDAEFQCGPHEVPRCRQLPERRRRSE